MKELYRAVRDFPKYRVTDAGRVFCYKGVRDGKEVWRELLPSLSQGHPQITMMRDGRKFRVRVAKLVWYTFALNKSALVYTKVRFAYKDGDSRNCALDNLELMASPHKSRSKVKAWWHSLSAEERNRVMEMWLRLKG